MHGRARRSWAAARNRAAAVRSVASSCMGCLKPWRAGVPLCQNAAPVREINGGAGDYAAGGRRISSSGAHRIEKLTIGLGGAEFVATALIDTGSRIAEVIFEEFKGTVNLCEGPARA